MQPVLVRMQALATVAVAGLVAMGLEMAAFRLYAPYFGYSVFVWGSMILVIMGALAAGYALGGRYRHAGHPRLLYRLVLASAAYQLLMIYLAPLILTGLATGDEIAGVAVATLLIFAPPTAVLAAIGPAAIRWCSSNGEPGSAAGTVYALSTIGSTGGIVLTSFVLIPRWGTHTALQVLCFVAFVAGVPGLNTRRSAWAAGAVPLMLLSAPPDFGWSDGTIWAAESAYNLIRVVRRGSELALTLNNAASVHTVQNESGPWTNYYYDDFAIGPALVRTNRLLVLGMGAGASIRATRAVAPDLDVDAVEIDPKVIEAAVRCFGLNPNDRRLRIHAADARPWLRKNRNLYGLVHVDLYQGGPYIPFYLATREFFQLIRAHMTADGLLIMNVFDPSPRLELLDAMGATLGEVFPQVMTAPAPTANHIVLAFSGAVTMENVSRTLANGPEQVIRNIAPRLRELRPPQGTAIFTDDHAPVEELTRRALKASASL